MKTLRILIALCIMLGFVTYAVNAQAQTFKDAGEYRWFICCPGAKCEYASGVYTLHMMWSANDNMQMWTWRGILIGDDTKAEYSFKDMWIIQAIRDGNNYEEPFNQSGTMVVHKGGKPFAKCHYSFHITYNSKGEITNVKDNLDMVWECF